MNESGAVEGQKKKATTIIGSMYYACLPSYANGGTEESDPILMFAKS